MEEFGTYLEERRETDCGEQWKREWSSFRFMNLLLLIQITVVTLQSSVMDGISISKQSFERIAWYIQHIPRYRDIEVLITSGSPLPPVASQDAEKKKKSKRSQKIV